MKPRKSKRPGYTPSFPALRDELIPPSPLPIIGSTGAAAPGSFLPGIALAAVNDKPPFGSVAWWRSFDNYCASDVWKRRRDRRCALANHQCSEDGCPRPATECHHLNYDRWSKGEELDSDLSPLCKPHHEIADARRRRESKREREKTRAAAYDEAGFDRRMTVRHGNKWWEQLSSEEVAEERDEWRSDREADDYQ